MKYSTFVACATLLTTPGFCADVQIKQASSTFIQKPFIEETITSVDRDYLVNFPCIPLYELTRFISKIAQVNFVASEQDLQANVSLISGNAASPSELLQALLQLLENQNLTIEQYANCYVISKKKTYTEQEQAKNVELAYLKEPKEFYTYKLQYHPGKEILQTLQQGIHTGSLHPDAEKDLIESVSSMQLIESSNSLFFTGFKSTLDKVCMLIKKLDAPIKQVFIEVLAIETDIQESSQFGVKWNLQSTKQGPLTFGMGNTTLPENPAENNVLTNLSNATESFDLGLVGNILKYKNKNFLSLGSLLSFIQSHDQHSIVLNQKILAQENKTSQFFAGNTIPFAGSVVNTVGNGQQTTANIEYKDVGVMLNITPMVGEGDIVTLNLQEEITEALDQHLYKNHQLSGIQTSKTHMATQVHVPNQHFLILSAMTRTTKAKKTSGVPWVQSIPLIGSLFKHKGDEEKKSSLLIFVKPTIVDSTHPQKQMPSVDIL